MRARYDISIDMSRHLVVVDLGGLFAIDDVARYMGELRRLMLLRGVKPGYRIVVDVSDCTVQPQQMIVAMGQELAAMPKASAVAIVSQSALARLQIKRLFDQPYARICAGRADAVAWVLDGTEPP